MAREIERKYLVKHDAWRDVIKRSRAMRQGYLNDIDRCSIRVRLTDDTATLNIKSAELGVSRNEYEYPIDRDDAEEMLESYCVGSVIEKVRHYVEYGGLTWEIDEFSGANNGLIVAEVELDDEAQAVELPAWAGIEVTDDARYYNVALARWPYARWGCDT